MTQDEAVSLLERKGYREVHHFMDGDDMVYVMEKRRGPMHLTGQVEADGSVNGVDVHEFLKGQQASDLSIELVKIARELTGGLTSIKELVDFTKKNLLNRSRIYEFSRVYSQIGTGGNGVHCDIGSGNYHVWFEETSEDGIVTGFGTEVTVFGEGHKKIDDVWYDNLNNKYFKTLDEWNRILREFLGKLLDVEGEILAESEFDEL